jgi:hypothetical protein
MRRASPVVSGPFSAVLMICSASAWVSLWSYRAVLICLLTVRMLMTVLSGKGSLPVLERLSARTTYNCLHLPTPYNLGQKTEGRDVASTHPALVG